LAKITLSVLLFKKWQYIDDYVGNNGNAVNLLNFDQNKYPVSLLSETLQFADGSQVNLADLSIGRGVANPLIIKLH